MSSHAPDQLMLFEQAVPRSTRQPKSSTLFKTRAQPDSPAGNLQMCVLGSGSSGNSTVIRYGDHAILIDAGFGPRATARRLVDVGLTIDDIDAICLTHLDRDHFNPNWTDTLCRKRINVYVHSHHVHGLYRRDGARLLHRAGLLHVVNGQGFEPAPGVRAHTIGLPHDRTGTVGYLIETPGTRIGYATDLGSVPDELIDRFAGVDLLAIESNYDEQMQQDSPRPPMLKQRIMGPAGHLSNEQAFEAVLRITNACPRGGPGHVVLLHRSGQCNCPTIVRQVFAQDSRIAGRLTLTEQQQASEWLAVGA